MPPDQDSNWGALAGIGLQMMVGVILGLFIGQWVDRRFHWAPWGTLIGSVIGLAAGMYTLIREGMRVNRDPPGPKKPGSQH